MKFKKLENNLNNVVKITEEELQKEAENIICHIFSVYFSNENKDLLNKDFTVKDAVIARKNNYFHLFKKDDVNLKYYSFQSEDGIDFYASDAFDVFGLKKYGDIRFTVNNKKLKICAPVKDMDISGLELTEGYKLQKKHIPDPVVLQPVKGGYLCLAKWGQEANDPILANELDN